MPSALDKDLEKIKAQAFDRADWTEKAIRRYHAVTVKLDASIIKSHRGLYDRIFVPTTTAGVVIESRVNCQRNTKQQCH